MSAHFEYNDLRNRVSNAGACVTRPFPRKIMPGISLRINGENREVPEGLTVLGLLEWLQLNPQRVAVELNRQIVPRPAWDRTPLEPGAELEIVQFVGGG